MLDICHVQLDSISLDLLKCIRNFPFSYLLVLIDYLLILYILVE